MNIDQPHSSLGQALYKRRLAMDWSREALAQRARVAPATIARLENEVVDGRTGRVNAPKPDTLRRLALALGHRDTVLTEEIRRELFDAAGYGETPLVDPDRAAEVEELRRRIEALESRLRPDPPEIEQIRRLVASYPTEQRQAVVKLIQETLERDPVASQLLAPRPPE